MFYMENDNEQFPRRFFTRNIKDIILMGIILAWFGKCGASHSQ